MTSAEVRQVMVTLGTELFDDLGYTAVREQALERAGLKEEDIPPEELRVSYVVLSRSGTTAKLLVVSAMEKTLAKIERVFNDAGIEPILIEPLGLNLWNAISVRESAPVSDRLFLYLRESEFTTAVFRGEEPIFIRTDDPITVALSPRRMKIAEKLAMNSRLGTSTRRTPAVRRSAGVTPMTVER